MRLTDADAGVVPSANWISPRPAELVCGARKQIQMVVQDPFTSLNPRRRVGGSSPTGRSLTASRGTAFARADELLTLVGLDPGRGRSASRMISGGQRQRIGLRARWRSTPTAGGRRTVSALERLGPAQVLALLETLKTRLRLAMLFITMTSMSRPRFATGSR